MASSLIRIRRHRDDAVSPVIAVILMVAITVVLAATVYVWVSGFSDQQATPARTIALASAGAPTATHEYNYTVTSATPGLTYADLILLVDGTAYTFTSTTPTDGEWGVWRGGTTIAASSSVQAGDVVEFDSASTLSGRQVIVVDAGSNSVMTRLTLR